MQEIFEEYKKCTLCPRNCGADRYSSRGFCMAGAGLKIARAALHLWEEPCLSGEKGSGAIFFSHCSLRCIYCQNHTVSHGGFGREISSDRLAEIMLELKAQGAVSIDLVTPTHYLPHVIKALDKVKPELDIPVIYNCGGYETAETVERLSDHIDIWLPDMKYADSSLAGELSAAPDYPGTALKAIKLMAEKTGRPVIDKNTGLMKSGVIVRHLVLPGHRDDSCDLLERLAEEVGAGNILISLLSQYTPFYKAKEIKSLDRRITSYEYDKVTEKAVSLSFRGYMQERSSAREEYTPSFDLSGV